jgi:hypothetical protein
MKLNVGDLTSLAPMSYYVVMANTSSLEASQSDTADKREHLRFDKVFPVRLESVLFGEIRAIARNVSAGGIFVEMRDPLPIGSRVRVSFLNPQETTEIIALGEVKNHYFINYAHKGSTQSVVGMAIRFEKFEEDSKLALSDCLNRFRVLN